MFRSITVLILALTFIPCELRSSQTNITYVKVRGDSITTGYNNSFFFVTKRECLRQPQR
jgi:hypothetical protein